MLRRFFGSTVWARAGVPAADWRYRGLYRFVLPFTDLFFCYFGVVGWAKGVASVQAAAGHEWATGWSVGIALAAFGALVGVSFPRLWSVELVAKVVLIGLVSSYVALSISRIVTDFSTSASAGLVMILILLPIWRVGDLGFVAWQRGHGGGHK